MENNLRDDNELSPTRAIYLRLKPLWEAGTLDDQDWAYVLVCLRRIEKNQNLNCMECLERALIEAI